MKKFLLILLLLTFFGCHYSSNRRINNKVTPVTIIAIDSISSSVILRDGENNIFTIYDTPTTMAISSTLKKGDTVRIDDNGKVEKVMSGNF
jgi:hypothetical protein